MKWGLEYPKSNTVIGENPNIKVDGGRIDRGT